MTIATVTKKFDEIVTDHFDLKSQWPGWDVELVLNEDNCTYLLLNHDSREAVWVDPMREDWEVLQGRTQAFRQKGYRFLTVVDSHTHADHISCAADLAKAADCPLIMHERAPSRRIDLRLSRDTILSAASAPVKLLCTPGHTPDSVTVLWGPFILGADTLLYGDTGRDDLPGGDPAAHYDSLQKIKAHAKPNMVLLPGHDGEGGRASSWATQLQISPSLTQDHENFVREAGAYVGPSPKILKESLFENFK